MGKVGKRVVIVVAALVVVFFGASFAIDRIMLNQTFERKARDVPDLLPTEAYMSSYKSTPVEFQMDGETLRGFVYEADNPKGFIVFRHGMFSHHADYLALISAMVDRGWTVFAYDARGCGISDGDSAIGMAQSALDVAAAVEFVRDTGLAGDLPLVLWGHSWGGHGVAAAMDIVPDVDACVTMSGYNASVDVLMEWATRMMGPIAVSQYPTLWLNNKLTFGDDADRTALDGINKTDTPVLVVHGADDAVVGYGNSAIIAQRDRISNPGVEYLTFDQEGRNGHNSYFYSAAANSYLNEKQAEWESIQEQYPNGVPDDVVADFMAAYDEHRGNVAAPDLVDAIDKFLTKAIGGDVSQTTAGQYGVLQSARYSNSGNSLGNRYELEAMRADDGSVIVCERVAEMHSMPTAVREYRADADLLDRISAMVDAAGAKEWDDLPLNEFIAYDASTPALSLTYANANPDEPWPLWITISTTYLLPEGGRDLLLDVSDLLSTYVTDGGLVREYTLQGD